MSDKEFGSEEGQLTTSELAIALTLVDKDSASGRNVVFKVRHPENEGEHIIADKVVGIQSAEEGFVEIIIE